ncbi:MAG: GntR family transcriptional regulator [Streptosporangiales bacterium]|nr:GntR family transcriptional regulator [Streptosporangiales bacterium]
MCYGEPVQVSLESDRVLLDRTSTAERVADILRTRIIQGFFPPGRRLVEGAIDAALGVSRNTLREAFRLLTHEGLLTHELNRGVFVRIPSVADVVDIYRVRRLVECPAVRGVTADAVVTDAVLVDALERIGTTLAAAERAEAADEWLGLGTANILFHQEIARLAGSPRVDELMRRTLAELRLVFHVMADPRRFHEPYLDRNRQILERLRAGDGAGAEVQLTAYLDDAERQLVQAYTAVRGPDRHTEVTVDG